MGNETGLVPLDGLLQTLELLVAQARAYALILPRNNHPALAATGAMGELAQRALNEARDLDAILRPLTGTEQPLTPRERQVLSLAAQGLTNKEIAYRLGISERTVQFHMNSVFNKTGTASRTQAATLALKQGWL